MPDQTKREPGAAGAKAPAECVLTINSGSSSIKFSVYPTASETERIISGKIERIGLPEPRLSFRLGKAEAQSQTLEASDHRQAGEFLIRWLEDNLGFSCVQGIGHRVVHGGPRFRDPQRINSELLEEMRRLSPYDPEHLPSSIQLMEIFHERHPQLPQVACFDTAFHRDMPRVARLLPIPRRYDTQGVQRFGFHGLSYAYLLQELERLAGPQAARGRLILAHLGNGASLAAVRDGKSIDTSMGFTPVAGVPMSTRSGDLDPGLFWYLARTQQMTGAQFHDMVHHQSGLLGVSETSPDMRDLLERETQDVRAAEAVALFCYQVKKWVGAFAAALAGVDTLVFAGGIGENAFQVRERVCEGLDFLGVRVDPERNRRNAGIISPENSPVTVRVIKTDEELMLARAVCQVLNIQKRNSNL